MLVGLLPQPRLRAGVGEDVAAFGRADVGGHRNHRHTGDQAAGDGQHGRRGRGGQHRDPVRAADPFGHRGRGADEVAAAQHGAVDAHRVGDVGARPRRRRGSARPAARQRGYPSTALGILGAWNQIERMASREVYRNNWMTVREDEIRRPDGSTGIYGVIDKPTYALVDRAATATASTSSSSSAIRSACGAGSFRRAPRRDGADLEPRELATPRAARGDRAARRFDGADSGNSTSRRA